jgi:ABC-type transporter MlaC component
MTSLQFKPAEKKRGKVRVRLKVIDGKPKVSKWNYRTKRWSQWRVYEG